MSTSSAPELLVLHAVRVLGFASGPQVAARYRLDQREVDEHLLDEQAAGLVQRVAFADVSGWSLTEAGRLADERRLSEELGAAGCRPGVLAAAREFEAVNDRFLRAMTDWQIRPQTWDRLAANDHTDATGSGSSCMRTCSRPSGWGGATRFPGPDLCRAADPA